MGLSTIEREQLAQELIDNVTTQQPKTQAEAQDSMSECSGGSDSDPAEDTLAPTDFAEVLPDKLIKQLRMAGLHEPAKAHSTYVINTDASQNQLDQGFRRGASQLSMHEPSQRKDLA